jgi:hypothetical protein
MKFATVTKSIVLGFAVLLASTAFASTKANLQLTDPVSINGTTLKPGDYKVQWEGNGPSVELNIMQGKNVVAKVPAHLVELKTPAPNNAALTRTNDNGKRSLTGARFEGKKIAVDFSEGGDAMGGGSSK